MSKTTRTTRARISEATKMKTAKILRGLRRQSGLTISEVSERGGVNCGTLHHMETGKRCNPRHFKKLVCVYKASKKVFEKLGRKSMIELGYFSVVGKKSR